MLHEVLHLEVLHLEVLHEVLHLLLHLEVQGYQENFVKPGLKCLKYIYYIQLCLRLSSSDKLRIVLIGFSK